MPIIFVPGIKASKLADTFPLGHEVRWSAEDIAFGDLFESPFDFELLAGRYDTGPHLFRASEVIAYPYGRLINYLRREVDPRTYVFTYDWREQIEESARKLNELIDEVLGKARAEGDADATVRFVTHSMGGMVLRSALRLRRPNRFKDIGRIVFIAPPFQGSCDIPKVLVAGEKGGWLSNAEDFRKLARTFPSVYELLPSYRAAAVDSSSGQALDLFDYGNWQENAVQRKGTERDKLQPDLLANAEAFRRGRRARYGGSSPAPLLTDGQLRRHADDIAVLMSVGYETVYRIPVVTDNARNPNWFDFDNQLADDGGDLRVHLKSAAVRGITLAAYRGIKSHALMCRENIIIKSAGAWLQGNRLLKMRPRRPLHSVARAGRNYFEPWNGRAASFAQHIVEV